MADTRELFYLHGSVCVTRMAGPGGLKLVKLFTRADRPLGRPDDPLPLTLGELDDLLSELRAAREWLDR